ncbi:UNVERIFIED_ORG: crotonobetaine/carnitine-CoA ligase [Gordonia westfalica J30]
MALRQTRHYPLPALEHRTLPDALATAAMSEHPTGVSDRDKRMSTAQLLEDATSLAHGLRGLGIEPGQPVVTMLDNHLDHVRLWFALSLGGYVSVPLNTTLRGDQARFMLHDSAAKVLVCEQHLLAELVPAVAGLPQLNLILTRGDDADYIAPSLPGVTVIPWNELPAHQAAPLPVVRPDDPQAVMYTSGSTGRPKGVLVTQAQTYTRAAVLDQRVDSDHLAMLSPLPLFHVAGQCRGVLGPIIQGIESVVLPRFSVRSFWDDVRTFHATSTLLMGTMASYLLTAPPRDNDRDHSLQLTLMSPITERSLEFAERFGTHIVASYGTTEVGTIASGETHTSGSLGWVHPAFEVRVAADDDREVPVGDEGELLVRGREPWTTTPGYHGNPQATVQLWRNQWLHTGDRVRITPTGELIFAGRSKDIIRRGGENISPSDVEQAVRSLPGVQDCVALGVPSPDGEEDVKILVITDDADISEPQIHAALVPMIPRFMHPRYIELVEAFALTPTAKPDKPAMRAVAKPQVWHSF